MDGVTGDHLTSALDGVLKSATVSINQSSHAVSSIAAASVTQLSPLAQTMGTLRQLQESDPTKYREVAQQIAASLRSDAQTAQSEGQLTTAERLHQLAGDFANASENGQLPNLTDLVALNSL